MQRYKNDSPLMFNINANPEEYNNHESKGARRRQTGFRTRDERSSCDEVTPAETPVKMHSKGPLCREVGVVAVTCRSMWTVRLRWTLTTMQPVAEGPHGHLASECAVLWIKDCTDSSMVTTVTLFQYLKSKNLYWNPYFENCNWATSCDNLRYINLS